LQVNVRNGQRCSAARGYLDPARHRRNCAWSPTRSPRASRSKARARPASSTRSAVCRKSSVPVAKSSSARGPIRSPQLLELSGVGDADILGRLGRAARGARAGSGPQPSGSPDAADHPMKPIGRSRSTTCCAASSRSLGRSRAT
jgi:choline dehydrogenase